jgi:hypothetical protein
MARCLFKASEMLSAEIGKITNVLNPQPVRLPSPTLTFHRHAQARVSMY